MNSVFKKKNPPHLFVTTLTTLMMFACSHAIERPDEEPGDTDPAAESDAAGVAVREALTAFNNAPEPLTEDDIDVFTEAMTEHFPSAPENSRGHLALDVVEQLIAIGRPDGAMVVCRALPETFRGEQVRVARLALAQQECVLLEEQFAVLLTSTKPASSPRLEIPEKSPWERVVDGVAAMFGGAS